MNLIDCNMRGSRDDCELFIVEGLSAAANVRRGRDANTQAVLALQGKPVNAAKASPARVGKDEQVQALIKALGCGSDAAFDLSALRYKRIVLLFDPDADGIHCGALLQIFLHQCMPEIIAAQKVFIVRAPLLRLTVAGQSAPILAYSEQHYQKLCMHFEQQGIKSHQHTRFKGVASFDVPLLRESCLDLQTRRQHILQLEDTAMAVKIFAQ